MSRRWSWFFWVLAPLAWLVQPLFAQQTPPAPGSIPADEIRTSVVVDANPALFAVLAALNVAGYDVGLKPDAPDYALRRAIRADLNANPLPVLDLLKGFYATHHRDDPIGDLQQYVYLSLFLGHPPGLSLTVAPAALPPEAMGMDMFVPLLQRFYREDDVAAVWNKYQPEYLAGLERDAAVARKTTSSVDTFFRMPQPGIDRQFFIYADALMSPTQTAAFNYQDNYYIVVSLDFSSQAQFVRHSYLHFVLDPLVGRYPAILQQVEQQILPLVAKAPGLAPEFKMDAQSLFTECLVRAVEIQMEPASTVQRQQLVDLAMHQGLVLTQYWYDQLTTFRADPANFTEYYPQAAFDLRLDELATTVKKLTFSDAPPPPTQEARPVVMKSFLNQGLDLIDTQDLNGAQLLADTAVASSTGDQASAHFLLGEVATKRNQPQTALAEFQKALDAAKPTDIHVRTWGNLYMAQLYDYLNNRAEAVKHYQAALLTANTPKSKEMAEAGVKAPYKPAGH